MKPTSRLLFATLLPLLGASCESYQEYDARMTRLEQHQQRSYGAPQQRYTQPQASYASAPAPRRQSTGAWRIMEELDSYEKAHPQPKRSASENEDERRRRAENFDNTWQPIGNGGGGYQGMTLWNPYKLPWE